VLCSGALGSGPETYDLSLGDSWVILGVIDNYFHGLESIRVYKLHEMLKRSTGESLFFQVASQVSGQSVDGSIQGLFCEADQRSVGNCT
jgi:hypothetical protein